MHAWGRVSDCCYNIGIGNKTKRFNKQFVRSTKVYTKSFPAHTWGRVSDCCYIGKWRQTCDVSLAWRHYGDRPCSAQWYAYVRRSHLIREVTQGCVSLLIREVTRGCVYRPCVSSGKIITQKSETNSNVILSRYPHASLRPVIRVRRCGRISYARPVTRGCVSYKLTIRTVRMRFMR